MTKPSLAACVSIDDVIRILFAETRGMTTAQVHAEMARRHRLKR